MSQTREKWNSLVLSRGDFWLAWRCNEISFLFFCLEPTVKKKTGKSTISIAVILITSKGLESYLISAVQSSFATFTRHFYNGVWKTSCSWRFYRNGSTCVLILSWVNIITQKWATVSGKLSIVQKSVLLNSPFSLNQAFFFNLTSYW